MKKHKVLIGVLVALGVLLIVGLVAGAIWGWSGHRWGVGMMGYQRFGPGMMRHLPFRGGLVGGGLGVTLCGLLAIAAIGALVWWLASAARKGTPAATQPDSALEILRLRYARGEIDGEEFQRIKESLQN